MKNLKIPLLRCLKSGNLCDDYDESKLRYPQCVPLSALYLRWGTALGERFQTGNEQFLSPCAAHSFQLHLFCARAITDPDPRGTLRGFSHPDGGIQIESTVGSGLFAKNCGALIRSGRGMAHGRSVISFACCASLSFFIASSFAESPKYQVRPVQCLSYLPPPVE